MKNFMGILAITVVLFQVSNVKQADAKLTTENALWALGGVAAGALVTYLVMSADDEKQASVNVDASIGFDGNAGDRRPVYRTNDGIDVSLYIESQGRSQQYGDCRCIRQRTERNGQYDPSRERRFYACNQGGRWTRYDREPVDYQVYQRPPAPFNEDIYADRDRNRCTDSFNCNNDRRPIFVDRPYASDCQRYGGCRDRYAEREYVRYVPITQYQNPCQIGRCHHNHNQDNGWYLNIGAQFDLSQIFQ